MDFKSKNWKRYFDEKESVRNYVFFLFWLKGVPHGLKESPRPDPSSEPKNQEKATPKNVKRWVAL